MTHLVGLDVQKIYKDHAKIMADNPTHVGTVLGYRFFEHPRFGDESCLLVTHTSEPQKIALSYFHEVPHIDEITD